MVDGGSCCQVPSFVVFFLYMQHHLTMMDFPICINFATINLPICNIVAATATSMHTCAAIVIMRSSY